MIIHKINEKINLKIKSIISKNDLSLCAKGILICVTTGENIGKIYTEKDFCSLLSNECEYLTDLPRNQLDALNELFDRKYLSRYASINKNYYIKMHE